MKYKELVKLAIKNKNFNVDDWDKPFGKDNAYQKAVDKQSKNSGANEFDKFMKKYDERINKADKKIKNLKKNVSKEKQESINLNENMKKNINRANEVKNILDNDRRKALNKIKTVGGGAVGGGLGYGLGNYIDKKRNKKDSKIGRIAGTLTGAGLGTLAGHALSKKASYNKMLFVKVAADNNDPLERIKKLKKELENRQKKYSNDVWNIDSKYIDTEKINQEANKRTNKTMKNIWGSYYNKDKGKPIDITDYEIDNKKPTFADLAKDPETREKLRNAKNPDNLEQIVNDFQKKLKKERPDEPYVKKTIKDLDDWKRESQEQRKNLKNNIDKINVKRNQELKKTREDVSKIRENLNKRQARKIDTNRLGTITGAMTGAGAGYGLGNYIDKKRDKEDSKIGRIVGTTGGAIGGGLLANKLLNRRG